ncbi:G-type lectin S-receptor-like serine/threonine-protein kinase SD3-1 [Lactuca sativa]|uniref:G-type lectin S-receptor-like serine/threonine-protein kinase SD3-1 n=1 Tax=Lactuca sativa TaxID=4236 RepID=UPI001C68D941|nr:G-type lectin S-receptor-like serine/threonine-protein kinase SD3-1 [Lactuca sativa]
MRLLPHLHHFASTPHQQIQIISSNQQTSSSLASHSHHSYTHKSTIFFSAFFKLKMLESLFILMDFQIPIKNIKGSAYDSDSYVDGNRKGNNLVSENGIFEFGFFEKDGGEFVVEIRYNLGLKTANLPVWTVGGGVRVPINSTLKLSMDGRLILFENPSNSIVWSSNTSNSGVESVTLLNNGNLVLIDSQNTVIWESFHRPTNTLLPGQFLQYPQNLRPPSTKSITSYYTFVIRPEGIALMWESNITYWKPNLSTSRATIKEVRFDSNGVLGLYDNSNKVIWSISSTDFGDTSVNLRHLRIDQDGNLRIYSWNNVLRSWKVGWQAVEDQCNVFGSCGLYSVCGYNSTGPICGCLYSDSVDEGNSIPSSDSGSGCKKMVDLANCKHHTSMLLMKQTVLYGLYPPHDIDMMLSEESCKEYCSNDTTCLALTSKNDGSGLCTLKRTGFISGSTGPSIPSTSFLKVCLVPQAVATKGGNPNAAPKSISFPFQGNYRKVIGAIAFVILVTVSVILGIQMFTLLFVYHKRRKNSEKIVIGAKTNLNNIALVRLSFKEVEELTSGFSTPLGSSVFKGVLPEKMAVVVKVVEGTVVSEKDFVKATAVLGGTHHRNLVSVKGFCFEPKQKVVLIYEYISNGSADKWVFEDQIERNWQKRVDIALGVTRALAYLHTECQLCIPHGNLKLENVLFDERMVPKLTDFGIKSFLCSSSSSSSNQSPSEEDIYMLGKLLIEIVLCGRDAAGDYSLDQVMEKVIIEQKYLDNEDLSGVERVVRIALWCMQNQPFLRPSVGEVMKVLEGTLSVDRPPSSFAYRYGDDTEKEVVVGEIESGS